MYWEESYAEGTDLDEFRDEVAAEVEGDEGLEAADTSAADENGGRSITRLLLLLVVVGESSDLVIVQFDDGGVDANGGEELLHDVTHVAGAFAEYDDRVLGDEAADAGLGGLGDVDGES
ncbi:hypothetical protein DVH24_020452 [Malus domestica]|uniref:Uncharacterized protein n=1 Tax=Malus domestica TaxID=3750 RepID=A0A498J6N7_MALDO|nr:hypothetical protein DVH24_020452 [Malus domestica]